MTTTVAERLSRALTIPNSLGSRSRDGSRSGSLLRTVAGICCTLALPLGAGPALAEAPDSGGPLTAILRTARETDGLPLEFALRVSGRLRLQLHQREDFLPAHFAPLPLRPLEEDGDAATLPALPTLYLYGPAYAPEGSLRAVRDLPVDSAEGLFNALLLAYFELEALASESELRRALEANARARLPELEAQDRVPALIQGLADFGSHALSVANRLSLLEEGGRDRDLCSLLDHPGTLFGLWDRIFGDGVYLARFYRPAGDGELTGRWVETSRAITGEDKGILLEHVFDNVWAGDRKRDLAPRFCPPPQPAGEAP